MSGKSIIVLSDAISFGAGSVASATFFDEQPFGQGYKTNKTRQGIMITESDWPALLRNLADVIKQEDVVNLTELSAAVKRMTEE